MRNALSRFLRDERGMAAEFALVLPLLLIFVLGTIDVGLYAWRLNQAEKATQMGARWAAVNDPLATEISAMSFPKFGQGDRIPLGAFTTITCNSGGCGTNGTLDQAAFNALADRMRVVFPAIQNTNIEVTYSDSGLGYAGNPNGPDASPLITVKLEKLEFTPITLLLFGANVPLPKFAYTLTAEDMCSPAPDPTTPKNCKA